MKKTFLAASLCLAFSFCSRKSVPPPPAGISNVSVGRGDTMAKAETAGAGFTTADRDWAYTANRDTSLNGTWALDGYIDAGGNWMSTRPAVMTDFTVSDTALMATPGSGSNEMGKATAKGKKKKSARTRAEYDSARARLSRDYKAGLVRDTTALPPFEYWKRTPTLTINASRLIFSGNTGCNSMSGSFNFSNKDIQFGRNIVTSRMACNDYDENTFLSALKRADNYTMNGHTLELRQGSTLLLTFTRS